MTFVTVPMVEPEKYWVKEYGIVYRSEFIYRVSGRYSALRIQVWDNAHRPNTIDAGYGSDAMGAFNYGKIGPGEYVDPNRKGTDERYSVLIATEATAITNSGTNTGTAASGQVWAETELNSGDTLILMTPASGGGYVAFRTGEFVQANRNADPKFIARENVTV